MFGWLSEASSRGSRSNSPKSRFLPVWNFDGDFLVDPRVFRQIDTAEPAAAKGRQDAVFPDCLSTKEHLCR
jgi:hypothetical protein